VKHYRPAVEIYHKGQWVHVGSYRSVAERDHVAKQFTEFDTVNVGFLGPAPGRLGTYSDQHGHGFHFYTDSLARSLPDFSLNLCSRG